MTNIFIWEQMRYSYYTYNTWVSAEHSMYVTASISSAMCFPALSSLAALGFSFLRSNFVPTNNIGVS